MTYPQPYQQPMPPAPPPPPPKASTRQWIVGLSIVGAIAATIAIAGLASSGGSSSPSGGRASETQLETAHDSCTAGEIADGGQTLILDMEGEEYGTGTSTLDDVTCVLVQLETPSSVTSRMDSTRALDGMQDAAWDGISASWTYHPDDGLDIILTLDG